MSNLNPEQFSYRGQHQPSETGAPLHKADEVYPDVYERPHLYTFKSDPATFEAAQHIIKYRDKPDADIMIHRAVPAGVKDINPGDFVTTSRRYAQQHADQFADTHKYDVISKKVKVADVRTDGDYLPEFGYFPGGEK